MPNPPARSRRRAAAACIVIDVGNTSTSIGRWDGRRVTRLSAVRGGTDGATLSWRGIPCPNIGFGGRNCHGEREFLVVEEFEAALRVVLDLACGPAWR